MNLAIIILAIYLILVAVVTFGWLAVSSVLLGIFALVAGILFLLAELNIYPRR